MVGRCKAQKFRHSVGQGRVGNARFSGPSLKSLLEKAGVKDTAKHVVFRGFDVVAGQRSAFYSQHSCGKGPGRRYSGGDEMNGSALTRITAFRRVC